MSPNTTPKGHAQTSSIASVRSGTRATSGHSPDGQDLDRHARRGWTRHGSKSSGVTASSPSRLHSRDVSRERDATNARNKHESDLVVKHGHIEDTPSERKPISFERVAASEPARYTVPGNAAMAASRKQSSQSAHDLLRVHKNDNDPKDPRALVQEFSRTTSLRNLHQGSTQSTQSTPGGGTKLSGGYPEEKRGFFKRMFGSSSSRGNLAIDNMHGSPGPSRNASVITNSHVQLTERDSSPVPVTNRELTKKASFFRRKKKSIGEGVDIPQLPVQNMSTPDPTSTARSSLYRAMDQYLAADTPRTPSRPAPEPPADVNGSPGRTDDSASNVSTEGDPTLFHSGYTGSPTDAAGQVATPRTEILKMADPDGTPTRDRSSTADTLKGHSRSASIPNDRHSRDDGTVTPRGSSQHGQRNKSISDTSAPPLLQGNRHRPRLSVSSEHASNDRNLSASDGSFVTPSETPIRHEQTTSAGNKRHAPDDLGLMYQDADAADLVPEMHESSNTRNGSFATRNLSIATATTSILSDTAYIDGPSSEDQERALSIFNGSEDFIPRNMAAAYLGENKTANMSVLRAFFGLFEFGHQTILGGLRMLCSQIVLKAESQQVDRILVSFADRWCACNPNHGFMLKDVVHTMCYSLLLLNTDMHMADIESKMTRGQFVKNTLPTIKRVVAEATPGSRQTDEQAMQWQDSASSMQTDSQTESDVGSSSRRMSTDGKRPTLAKRLSWSFGMAKPDEEDRIDVVPNSGSTALVNDRFDGKPAEWHFELEAILKSFFTAIKNEALPLYKDVAPRIRRAGSIKSMAPSEMSMKSRKTGFHSVSARWGNRGARPKMYTSSQYASSRTSFDDGSSVFSHTAASSAWSKLSLGKTMTTMSTMDSSYHLGPDQGFPHTIGFANALSQINAREDGVEDDNASINPQKFLLEDDTLELAGAPWAKEGMVKHKHHLETTDKKAKERNWTESFAVIERGYLRLFSFNSKGGKSGTLGVRKTAQRGKGSSLAPSVVGGGNWSANAEQLGSFLLRQTIASTLPPPGYSKARPHVWALSLPSGAVHLFQVGTPEIAVEFMKTANYWSARLSKEPLMGGVENTEYGWSDNIIIPSLIHPTLLAAVTTSSSADAGVSSSASQGVSDFKPGHRHVTSTSGSVNMPRASISGSIRSGMDAVGMPQRSRLPGDKVHVEDWKPPAQSMMASQLMEVDQLKALKDYVNGVEMDLSRHNELRVNIPGAYSPRHPNAAKAIANWEKKSAYLLREIVKFRTYIDALNMAQDEKVKFDVDRADREKEKQERERRKEERKRLEAETVLAEEEGVSAPTASAATAGITA